MSSTAILSESHPYQPIHAKPRYKTIYLLLNGSACQPIAHPFCRAIIFENSLCKCMSGCLTIGLYHTKPSCGSTQQTPFHYSTMHKYLIRLSHTTVMSPECAVRYEHMASLACSILSQGIQSNDDLARAICQDEAFA